jgi:hypothetical protein
MLRDSHRLKVLENRVVRKILGHEREKLRKIEKNA